MLRNDYVVLPKLLFDVHWRSACLPAKWEFRQTKLSHTPKIDHSITVMLYSKFDTEQLAQQHKRP